MWLLSLYDVFETTHAPWQLHDFKRLAAAAAAAEGPLLQEHIHRGEVSSPWQCGF